MEQRELARRHREILERGRVALNSGDIESVIPFVAEDMELHPAVAGALAGTTVYRGKDGIRQYLKDITEVIEAFELEALEYLSWHDYVVVATRIHGHGRASGADIATEMTLIWRIEEGQIVWGGSFFSSDQGLDAIGGSEDELEPID